MRFSTLAVPLLFSAVSTLVSIVNAQPSPVPRAICYSCPEQDNAGVPLADAPSMGSDPFACVYGDADTCHYSIVRLVDYASCYLTLTLGHSS